MLLTPISDFTGDGKAHSVAAIMTLKGVPLPVPPLVRAISFRVAGSRSVITTQYTSKKKAWYTLKPSRLNVAWQLIRLSGH